MGVSPAPRRKSSSSVAGSFVAADRSPRRPAALTEPRNRIDDLGDRLDVPPARPPTAAAASATWAQRSSGSASSASRAGMGSRPPPRPRAPLGPARAPAVAGACASPPLSPVGQGGAGPECLPASHRRKLPAGAGQTPARCGEHLAGQARSLRRAAQRLRRWLGLAPHHPPAAVNARSRSRNSSGPRGGSRSERSRARRLGVTTGRASSARGEASFRSPLGMLSARTRRPSVLGQARAGKTCRPNASMNGPCSWPTWWRFTSSKPSAAASSIQATC